MAFAIYFTYFVWFAIQHRQFVSVPFLAMFQIGFLYVSLSSLGQWFPRMSFGRRARGGDTSRVTSSGLQVKHHSVMVRLSLLLAALFSVAATLRADGPSRVIISVKDQKLMLMGNGARLATYPVSTSKFGLGDDWGRMTTPLGFLQVAEKIGDHAPDWSRLPQSPLYRRNPQAECAKGRDPIITRIIWLRGLEASNAHAFSRCIYIHGTPRGKAHRPARQLRLHPDEVARCRGALRAAACRSDRRDRGRQAAQDSESAARRGLHSGAAKG